MSKSRKLTVHLSAFRVLLMLAIIALLSGVMACVLIERDSTLHSAAFVCSIIGLTLSIYVNRRVRSVQKHKVQGMKCENKHHVCYPFSQHQAEFAEHENKVQECYLYLALQFEDALPSEVFFPYHIMKKTYLSMKGYIALCVLISLLLYLSAIRKH